MHTDIRPEHLLFAKTPAAWHPYLRLARLDRPTGVFLLLLPCWWATVLAAGGVLNMNAGAWRAALLFAIGAVVMRAAGCVVNDLWDRRLDAEVERTKTRPLPAGEVTPRQARIFLAALLFLGFAVLLFFPWRTMILGALSLPLVAAYPLMKRVTWWPQAFLGLTFNWGALMGFSALSGDVGSSALLLYAGGVLWTLAYDTIYARQDVEDDARMGMRSTALLFGAKAKAWVGFFMAGALALILAAKFAAAPSILTPLLSVPAGVYAWRLVSRWTPEDKKSSLAAFKANTALGLLILLVLAL